MTAIVKFVAHDVLSEIKRAVGPKGYIEDPAEQAKYLVDERGIYHGRTPLVVRPASTEEVAAVVRICHRHRVPIVPQSGNTGLVGGSVPHDHGGEVVLSLARLDRIRAIDPLNYTMTVEAGCVLAKLQQAAAEADRLFPLSLASEGSCLIGGNLSTNAGGVQVLRYGNARDLVLGLEVVLPDGRIWDGLRALRKNNTGYDLKHLFIGGEGTLGIITAAVLKLYPRPRQVRTAMVAVPTLEAAIELLARVREGSGDQVSAFELIERFGLDLALEYVPGVVDPFAQAYRHYCLIEFSSPDASGNLGDRTEAVLGKALEDGLALDAVIAASEAQRQQLWRIREGIPEGQKRDGGGIKHDVSVPVSRVAAFIAAAQAACEAHLPGVRVLAFGHVGDGNVHFNLCRPPGMEPPAFEAHRPAFNRLVHDLVVGLGGSISAEHGIGLLKREELRHYASELELELMRRVKSALDPHDIMNPGKVI